MLDCKLGSHLFLSALDLKLGAERCLENYDQVFGPALKRKCKDEAKRLMNAAITDASTGILEVYRQPTTNPGFQFQLPIEQPTLYHQMHPNLVFVRAGINLLNDLKQRLASIEILKGS